MRIGGHGAFYIGQAHRRQAFFGLQLRGFFIQLQMLADHARDLLAD